MYHDPCIECEYKKLCREFPPDLTCEEVKKIAEEEVAGRWKD